MNGENIKGLNLAAVIYTTVQVSNYCGSLN
jgi:hypothetical protein